MKSSLMAVLVAGVIGMAWQADGFAQQQAPAKQMEVSAYGVIDMFTWEEFLNGDKLLTEEGPILGIGGTIAFALSDTITLEGDGYMFFGNIDYDGGIQNFMTGEVTPYQSNTEYTGIKMQGNCIYSLGLIQGMQIAPYAGLGLKYWQRDIDKKPGALTVGQYGYTEYWSTTYLALGVKATKSLGNDISLMGKAELKVTISNAEEADGTDLEPGEEPSYLIEGGARFSMFFATLYYEAYDFSKSPAVGGFLQPDSEARIIGIRGGVTF